MRKRAGAAPAPTHLTANTHKPRGEWFAQRSVYPLRDAPPAALEKFWDNPDEFAHIYGLNWSEAGPRNFPGRITSLVSTPGHYYKLYAGSAAGGVWVSEDGGESWTSCWPRLLNQHIGALAMDPVDPNVLFCATGEGNLSADSYCGSGVYQTEDGGFTWTLELSGARDDIPRRVGSIAFMLSKVQGEYGIVLGSVSSVETMPAALYIDQGKEGVQPCLFWGERNYNCHSVVAHPTKPGLLYAAIEPRGTLNGIWRSENFGDTWVHLKRGLPPGEFCRRISLAMAPSDPDTLYALIGTQDGRVAGVYRTSNGGESWRQTGGRHFERENQLNYNNTIAVHPKDPDFALCGAVNLFLTRNGGNSWQQVSTGDRGKAGELLPKNFVHSDHHAIVITEQGILCSANDGGMARSDDGGKTWRSASEGMVTAMFYAADVAQSDSRIFGGGTQDQGTLVAGVPATLGGPAQREGDFTRVLPGDGGWIAFDPKEAEHVFGSTSDLIFNRHKRGEPWAAGHQLGAWPKVSIDQSLFVGGENLLRNIAVVTIGSRRGRPVVYAGTNRLWRTLDDGRKWHHCSPFFDGSAISAIACSERNPDVIFVGTTAGGIFRTKDGAKTWSRNIAGPAVPRRVVTDIRFHPLRAKTVVASVAATATPGSVLKGRAASRESNYGHVFRSEDGGDTWVDIDSGALPDVVYNALAFESQPPYRLFAGGDVGVWMLVEHGERTTWASIAGNMPNVVVSDLRYHKKDRILTAATYGRGIWRLKIEEPFPKVLPRQKDAAADEPPALGLLCDRTKPAPALLSPDDGAVFSNFPRTTQFSWQPVEGAIGYTILLDYGQGSTDPFSSTTNQAKRDFAGAQEGSWRVWAIFPDGWRSPGSAVRKLKYTV